METTKDNTIIQHLIVLRKLFIISLVILGAIFLCLFMYSQQIYQIVALPLLAKLPVQSQMIATTVTAPLIVPIKLSFYGALFIATPVILFLCWRFIAPGLYENEKRIVWISLVATFLLFYIGMAVCYFLILPLIFNFLVGMVPSYIQLLPDMSHYLGFSLKLLFSFGLSFETPLVVVLIAATNILSIKTLKSYRPYVVVGAFIMGMLLTPPDIISQVCLAIPLWLLYEIGLLLSKVFVGSQQKPLGHHSDR